MLYNIVNLMDFVNPYIIYFIDCSYLLELLYGGLVASRLLTNWSSSFLALAGRE